ncbi:MAG: hypothetical protein ACJ718_00150 [Nitrososphaeraceae archaeon]
MNQPLHDKQLLDRLFPQIIKRIDSVLAKKIIAILQSSQVLFHRLMDLNGVEIR